MSSTTVSGGSNTEAPPSPADVLFARGILAGLRLWPALKLAIAENWGGPNGAAKLPWLAGEIVDAFTAPPSGEPPIDAEYIEDMLLQVMNDEFETVLEDGSAWTVATRIVALWDTVQRSGAEAERVVADLERKADEVKGKKVVAQQAEDSADSDDESGDEDEEMDVDEAPQLIDRGAPKPKEEPVVDEDGFTLVQGKGKGRR